MLLLVLFCCGRVEDLVLNMCSGPPPSTGRNFTIGAGFEVFEVAGAGRDVVARRRGFEEGKLSVLDSVVTTPEFDDEEVDPTTCASNLTRM